MAVETKAQNQEQQDKDRVAKLPKSKHTQAFLTHLQEGGVDLSGQAVKLLEKVTEPLRELETLLMDAKSKAVLALADEQVQQTRGDVLTLDNRISSGLTTIRDLQNRFIDLSNILVTLGRDSEQVVARAGERGYTVKKKA